MGKYVYRLREALVRMRTDERLAIIRIIKFSQKFDFEDSLKNKDLIKKLSVDPIMSSTIFGGRFIDRLKDLCEPGSGPHKCVLCAKNEASNGGVCHTCMAELGEVEEETNTSARYCRNCGARLNQGETRCRNCGFGIDEGYNYCACCGNKVPLPNMNVTSEIKDVKGEDSQTPDAIVQDIKVRLGRGFGIKAERIDEDIFCKYNFYELLANDERAGIIKVTSFQDKTINISFETYESAYVSKVGKVIIRMMEPDLTDFELNDLYLAAKERPSVYYYDGIYYECNDTVFAAGTEAYDEAISDHIDNISFVGSEDDPDIGDLLGKNSQDIEEYLKNSSIFTEIENDRVYSAGLCGLCNYQVMGIHFGSTEQKALEKMRKFCNNIYLDTEKGINDKYSYKGQVVIDGRNAQMHVSILCGHVCKIMVTLESFMGA